MEAGEFLTKSAIWLAISCYGFGAAGQLVARQGEESRFVRWAWTLGCGFFIAHVVAAFTFFHHWSHGAAYQETAEQTAEFSGVRWGGGLYLNYLFGLAWLADVVGWWVAPERHARRSPLLNAIWHGFAFFMVFNGAVVFGHGPVRWFGLLITGALAGLWIRRMRNACSD